MDWLRIGWITRKMTPYRDSVGRTNPEMIFMSNIAYFFELENYGLLERNYSIVGACRVFVEMSAIYSRGGC